MMMMMITIIIYILFNSRHTYMIFISVIDNMLDPPTYPPPLFLCASPAPFPDLNFLSFHLSLLHLFLCPSLFPLCVCVCVCVCVCARARVCVCVFVKAYGENACCYVCTNVPNMIKSYYKK